MIHTRISGTTRTLGKSQGYLGLNIRDEFIVGIPVMSSSWEFTPEDVIKLTNGGFVHLMLLGNYREISPCSLIKLFVTGTEELNDLSLQEHYDDDYTNFKWVPDKKELESIAEGESLYMMLAGTNHPPVKLSVTRASI